MLRAEQIELALRGTPVLRGVDAELQPGELLAVLGPNGAGKTSLLRVLAGTLVAQRGRVELDGRPLAALSRREIARAVAVVPQQLETAFPYRVREMVAMGRAPHLGPLGSPGARDRELVDRALAELDLEPLAERPFPELSAGEKQRVALARARAQDARIWLLDEPTAHMDLGHALRAFERVRAFAAGPRAALVVSHELGFAARFADRALLLDAGVVAARGRPADVITPERVRAVYQVDARIATDAEGRLEVVPLRYTPRAYEPDH